MSIDETTLQPAPDMAAIELSIKKAQRLRSRLLPTVLANLLGRRERSNANRAGHSDRLAIS